MVLRGPHHFTHLEVEDILGFLCPCFVDPWGSEAGDSGGCLEQRIAYECEAGVLQRTTRAGFGLPALWNLAGLREHRAGWHVLLRLFVGGVPESTLCVLHEEMDRGNQISPWACLRTPDPYSGICSQEMLGGICSVLLLYKGPEW